ncbi:hypothetical protein HIM_03135 [Hirsutella minnesotensis 3608]|nr:hypothetical protein HIM_03135 [Hirsutella minnesotensis 3608]
MPPQIVLIRHAQALHNVDNTSPLSFRRHAHCPFCVAAPCSPCFTAQELVGQAPLHYAIPDPPLSEQGVEQCAALRASLKERFDAVPARSVAVVVSPMVRTLQTASLALDWLRDKGVAFEADADWQENSAKPCDTGSPVSSVAAAYPRVDFSRLDPVWPDKTSPAGARYADTRDAILARGAAALETLYRRPEDIVFVVSHSGFLRSGVCGWWFFNADYRVFRFDLRADAGADGITGQGKPRRALQQEESTLAGGMGLSWTHQVELGFELPGEDQVPVEDMVV